MNRSTLDPDFDSRIADLFEADPDRAPNAVLETVLAAFPSIPQRRAIRVPWRFRSMTLSARLVAAAIAIAIVAVGGALFLRPGGSNVAAPSALVPSPRPSTAPTVSPSASPSTSAPASPGAPVDYSTLQGRILVEHLGNALDMTESTATDYNPDKRRFYFMDPADMTSSTAVEFLPGQPTTGKSAADISSDHKRIVFQDWAQRARLYEANLDGTGFRKIPLECSCSLLYPDYDPTATKIVYVRMQGGQSWLEILDLATNATTRVAKTIGSAADDVPEQPAWSPDGKSIAFTSLHWGGRNDPVVGTVRYGDVPPTSGTLRILNVASGTVTAVPLPAGELPGDANWSPDSTTLAYTSGPASTTGSNSGLPAGGGIRVVKPDGTGFQKLVGWGGPEFLPDRQHILFQENLLFLMNVDGTNPLPINRRAMDLSDLAQGFAYIAHWIPNP